MKKSLLLSCLIALFASFPFFSQSSEQISAILKSEKATCAQVSYLAAVYANKISDSDSDSQAFDALKSEGYFSDEASADSEVTLAEAAFVYAKALNLKGGLFYSLFKNKRYAYKELKAQGVLPSNSDPSMKISGRDSLDLFNACLSLAGENGGAE